VNSCLVTHDGSALNLHFHITAAVPSEKKNSTFNLDSVHHGGNGSLKHAHFKMCIKIDKVVFRIAEVWSGLITANQCGQSLASFEAVLGRGVGTRLGRLHHAAVDKKLEKLHQKKGWVERAIHTSSYVNHW